LPTGLGASLFYEMARKPKSNVLKENKIVSIRDVMSGSDFGNYNGKEVKNNTERKIMKSKVENNNSFFDQYKDPRWQQMRLKVMERDGFTCCHCYSKDKPLNVHHLIYMKNMNPWEYDPDDLITLCEVCHEKLTKHTNELIIIIRKLGMNKCFFYPTYDIIKSIQKICNE
jgi:hypothetical protein